MNRIKFEDHSQEVIQDLRERAIKALHESAGEIKSQVKRNSRVDMGELKRSWDYVVDESELEAKIGSPLENAIWEEFGTGEYAVKGNGRKGYWVYVKGSNGSSKKSGKSYTLAQAKRIMAILRSKGLEAYYTNGKTPNKTLETAIRTKLKMIKRIMERCFKN